MAIYIVSPLPFSHFVGFHRREGDGKKRSGEKGGGRKRERGKIFAS